MKSAGKLPREVLLLQQVDHAHIPHVVALFHNTTHYQVVMPSHEPAFDLFRFIDENPAVEEAVASHIFRQVCVCVCVCVCEGECEKE